MWRGLESRGDAQQSSHSRVPPHSVDACTAVAGAGGVTGLPATRLRPPRVCDALVEVLAGIGTTEWIRG